MKVLDALTRYLVGLAGSKVIGLSGGTALVSAVAEAFCPAN
jgi:hypothetical protein